MNTKTSIQGTNLIIIFALLMNLAGAIWMVRTPQAGAQSAASGHAMTELVRGTEAA